MDKKIGHNLNREYRSEDIHIKDTLPFERMNLNPTLKRALERSGYVYPTNIQATAIPLGIAGLDLLVQSKAGTGKTLIYCTTILQKYYYKTLEPQALIVVPTRELAMQIHYILNELSKDFPQIKVVSVIGGSSAADDRKHLVGAKIVIGTPGRLVHLIESAAFNTMQIRILVLDEADKLMDHSSFRNDLTRIHKALNGRCQIICCSATYENNLDSKLAGIMKNPILISTEKKASALVGIRQFVFLLPEKTSNILEMKDKLDAIRYIFGFLPFQQSVLFASSQTRAESYYNYLSRDGWPCDLLSASLSQHDRKQIFYKFRDFKTRILVATDLMSRGIDSEKLNLVINIDVPNDFVTYLHRVGRAGRFGSKGIAITFLMTGRDHQTFGRFMREMGNTMSVYKFPPRNANASLDLWDFKSIHATYEVFADKLGRLNKDDQAGNSKKSVKTDAQKRSDEDDKQKENWDVNKQDVSFDQRSGDIREQLEPEIFHISTREEETENENYSKKPKINNSEVSLSTSTEHLPLSSNTIDDASSLIPDSLVESFADISNNEEYEKKLKSMFNQMNTTCTQQNKVNLKKDFFADYESFVGSGGNNGQTQNSETNTVECQITPKEDFGKGAPVVAAIEKVVLAKPSDIDWFEDYNNFEYNEDSSEVDNHKKEVKINSITFTMKAANKPEIIISKKEELDKNLLNSSWHDPGSKGRIKAEVDLLVREQKSKAKSTSLGLFEDYENFVVSEDEIKHNITKEESKENNMKESQSARNSPDLPHDVNQKNSSSCVSSRILQENNSNSTSSKSSFVNSKTIFIVSNGENSSVTHHNTPVENFIKSYPGKSFHSKPKLVYLTLCKNQQIDIKPAIIPKENSTSTMPQSSSTSSPRTWENRGVQVSPLSFSLEKPTTTTTEPLTFSLNSPPLQQRLLKNELVRKFMVETEDCKTVKNNVHLDSDDNPAKDPEDEDDNDDENEDDDDEEEDYFKDLEDRPINDMYSMHEDYPLHDIYNSIHEDIPQDSHFEINFFCDEEEDSFVEEDQSENSDEEAEFNEKEASSNQKEDEDEWNHYLEMFFNENESDSDSSLPNVSNDKVNVGTNSPDRRALLDKICEDIRKLEQSSLDQQNAQNIKATLTDVPQEFLSDFDSDSSNEISLPIFVMNDPKKSKSFTIDELEKDFQEKFKILYEQQTSFMQTYINYFRKMQKSIKTKPDKKHSNKKID